MNRRLRVFRRNRRKLFCACQPRLLALGGESVSSGLHNAPMFVLLKGKIPMKIRSACAAVAVVCLLGPARLSADEIIDWNNVLLDTIRTNSISPLPATRVTAAMNTAMYDAVNSIARTHHPYHVDMTADPGTSREAAAAQAAHRVLSGLVPASQATYDAALANSLSSVPDGPGKTAGIALGNTVGAAILALRANDGASAVVPYTPGTQPGQWRPTPPANAPAAAPHWANVTPWAMTSPSQFRNPDGPPALDSAEYTAAFNQVKEIGSATSTTRTQDQSEHCAVLGGPQRAPTLRLGTGTGLLRRLPSPRVTRWRRTRGCLRC